MDDTRLHQSYLAVVSSGVVVVWSFFIDWFLLPGTPLTALLPGPTLATPPPGVPPVVVDWFFYANAAMGALVLVGLPVAVYLREWLVSPFLAFGVLAAVAPLLDGTLVERFPEAGFALLLLLWPLVLGIYVLGVGLERAANRLVGLP